MYHIKVAVNLLVLFAIGFAQTSGESSTEVTPTTKSPNPSIEEGSWNITEGNVTCIRAVLQIGITLNLRDEKLNFSLSPKASDDGSSCSLSNSTQQLKLSYSNYSLTFLFEKSGDQVYVKNLTLLYSSETGIDTFYDDTKLFNVRDGNAYLCKTAEDIKMGNATIQIYKIHLQAFGTAGEENFGLTQECEADDVVNDTIVIGVACALSALITIVLVAYLIGRRRVRQRGYTSV